MPSERHFSTCRHAPQSPAHDDTSLSRTAPKRPTYLKRTHTWHGVPTRLHQPAPSPATSSVPNGSVATGDPSRDALSATVLRNSPAL